MTCIKKITQSIVNSCRSVRGLKPRALWAYRSDCTFTFSGNVITAINCPIFGVFEGVKYSLNAGGEDVVAEDNGTGYKHKFNAIVNVNGQVDGLDDIVVFVQKQDGEWLAYGAKHGLWNATQSNMSNDNLATTTVELASLEGREEFYENYSVTANLSVVHTSENMLSLRIGYVKGQPIYLTNDGEKLMRLFDLNGNEIISDSDSISITAPYSGEYLFVFERLSEQNQSYGINGYLLSKDISISSNIGAFGFYEMNIESIFAPDSDVNIVNCPNLNCIVFKNTLNANNGNLSVSAIERILIDRVAKGTICNITLSGTNPAIGLWSAAAVAAKNALVVIGCTITYNS